MTVENISISVRTNADKAAIKINSLSAALNSLQKSATNATSVFGNATGSSGISVSTRKVGESAKAATKHTNEFASSLMRIAKYRFLRTVIKEIAQGFNEGLKNAYHFSKGINGSLAASLDSLATKSLTMKNQMGAAFGALLEAVMPIILQIISLIRELMQALSALFAAIGGGQYLVAKDAATAWDKATGAAKKYKNTILGFDEINRLDDPNSGGGGSGSDWSNMFEERELPKWAKFIKDNLKEIKDLTIAVGLAIAGWKIANALNGISGGAVAMSKLFGIAMSVAGAFLLVNGAIDAFTNGTTWENVNEMLTGTAILAGGLYLAFDSVGAAIGLILGGITLVAAALNDFIEKGELTNASLYALEGGLLAVGAGLALLTGSWIPLAIASFAGLVLAIGKHTDEINNAVDTFSNNMILKIDGFLKKIEEQTGIDLTGLRRTIMYFLNFIRFAIEADVTKIGWVVQDLGRIVKAVSDGDWDAAWSAMQLLTHDVSIDVSGEVKGMAESITDDMMAGKESTQDLSQAFKDLLIDVRNNAPLAETGITKFMDAVSDGATNAQTPLQNFWNKLSGILTTLQQISGVSTTGGGLLGLLQGNGWNFSLKETLGFASGGVHDLSMGSLFVAGEAGAEIVTNMGSGRTGVTNVEQMEAAVAGGNTGVINAIYNLIDAVNNKDTDVVLDGQSMARALYRPMQQETKRRGSNLVQGSVYA